jgi:hypothetical protein
MLNIISPPMFLYIRLLFFGAFLHCIRNAASNIRILVFMINLDVTKTGRGLF